MPNKRQIVIVGAGPGGLTAAMILAARGFSVTVCEKNAMVGGRNGELRLDDYRFDIGPTFLMMKFLLDQVFADAGRDSGDYLQFVKLDPMYRLIFEDKTMAVTSHIDTMRDEIERVFPGEGSGLLRFHQREEERLKYMYPCLQKDYGSLSRFLHKDLLAAIPHLSMGKSLYDVLSGYFGPEQLRLAFTFQSKYLGMSPWDCPGLFTIIPYIEHSMGIYHVMGGLCRISDAMAKVAQEHGAEIRLNSPVKRLLLEGRRVRGVELEGGEEIKADETVLNADFAHAMTTLVPPNTLRRHSPEKLARRQYSCSTYMLYLGLDTVYPVDHHVISFANDYRRNLEEITHSKTLSEDFSFYVRNASVTDPALAPTGHSAIYVLVPVPNQTSGIDWEKEKLPFRERVLDAMIERLPMPNLRHHIKAERIITPADWQGPANVYLGATFNLAHTLKQMLYFRPHNQFEELDQCYLVGGGTHPGSGLPTIYESARISANLISKKHGVDFRPPPPLSN